MKNQKLYPIEIPVGQRQLFIDNHCIGYAKGLKTTMHKPVKKGAVIRPDIMMGECEIQIRSAPSWDIESKSYRFLVAERDRYVWSSCDGLHWTRSGKSKLGNLWTVVYDKDEPDHSKRYKALLLSEAGVGIIGSAVSPDMIDWTIYDMPQIECSDEYNLSYDNKSHTYVATIKRCGEYGRSVYLTTSKDFLHWSEPDLIFCSDEEDQRMGREIIEKYIADENMQPKMQFPTDPGQYRVDVYNMGVFAYEGIYIGMPTMYHAIGPMENYPNTYGFDILQLVSSRDLKTWNRLGNRQAFISPSPKGAGAYDLSQIISPSSPVLRGDELWFYYTGLKYRGNWKYEGTYPDGTATVFHENEKDSAAICLAALRRDGFISMDAGNEPGKFITKPFKAEGTRLKVNIDAEEGILSVTAIDLEGNMLACSKTITGDKTDITVEWDKSCLSCYKGQIIRLEFILKNASLYSFWFEE